MARKETPRPRATVITGIPREFERPLFMFAKNHAGVPPEDTDIILQEHLDHALGWNREGFNLTERKVFQLKDIARTRAMESWRQGSRYCFIITDFVCDRCSREFKNECLQFARRQVREVVRWHLFKVVLVAGLMPDGLISPITGHTI